MVALRQIEQHWEALEICRLHQRDKQIAIDGVQDFYEQLLPCLNEYSLEQIGELARSVMLQAMIDWEQCFDGTDWSKFVRMTDAEVYEAISAIDVECSERAWEKAGATLSRPS